jgi:hypothetical protein
MLRSVEDLRRWLGGAQEAQWDYKNIVKQRTFENEGTMIARQALAIR